MQRPLSLIHGAVDILNDGNPWSKHAKTLQLAHFWRQGDLPPLPSTAEGTAIEPPPCVPDKPARSTAGMRIVQPGAMPKLGRGGTLASRQVRKHPPLRP